MNKWYPKVMQLGMEETLSEIEQNNVLENFYLAGGTAIALSLGHRRSYDLDFFSKQSFNEDDLLEQVKNLNNFLLISKALETLHANILESKVSFLGYPYPLIYDLQYFNNVPVADLRDLAAMKISAIGNRGSKRDFIDLFTVGKLYPFPILFETFIKKFSKVNYSKSHVLRSLTYFADAEKEAMPNMLCKVSWEEVKSFFVKEVAKL